MMTTAIATSAILCAVGVLLLLAGWEGRNTQPTRTEVVLIFGGGIFLFGAVLALIS